MWGEVEAEYGMVVGGGRGCKVVCEGGRLERWGGKCRVCGRVCVAGGGRGDDVKWRSGIGVRTVRKG